MEDTAAMEWVSWLAVTAAMAWVYPGYYGGEVWGERCRREDERRLRGIVFG